MFNNWAPGEPATMTSSNGRVAMDMTHGAKWKVYPCRGGELFADVMHNYVCEFRECVAIRKKIKLYERVVVVVQQ